MADVKFITREGDELSPEQTIQQLMQRVSELERHTLELHQIQDNILDRLHYLENHVWIN